ncbi:MAG TPA: twin-arginine translocation signal domain-containing protein [Pyrinomonadaceae bacterium]|nr:twin-arginine translocation signal domain-containing protein [Pyrinomonadaceae bacterium]
MKKPLNAESRTQETSDQIDRRSFVKFIPAIGAAGLVAANLPLTAPAQTSTPTPTPAASPSPTPSKPSPLAEAYAEVAKVRFGEHIETSQWEQLKRELEANVRNADRLRAAKLLNGDEPDFIFTA